MPEKVDVLICGSGCAGLCAGMWLARYGVPCKILEKRSGPLEVGQADGVQCRTVEIFESLGMSEELLRESYHVNEVAFWASDGQGGLRRTGTTADTMPGLSHLPHVILNQARINKMLIELMEKYNNQKVTYGYDVKSVRVNQSKLGDPNAYPVTVVTEHNGAEEVFEAKYALACDGAHSNVRRSLGFKMVGDTTDAVWGVMDVYPRTNFPDIRKKATIRTDRGNILIIPREGDSLARFYIELSPGTAAKEVTKERLHEYAKEIFHPYKMEIADTFWWSAFVIGQRLADNFHQDYRVFLTGDACHTHSPKAGQGMNTSLQDGYNIGWKLASVLKGLAGPELLKTYVLERQMTAKNLIDFDRYFSKLFSRDGGYSVTPEHFDEQFKKSGRYTAGLTSTYEDSIITSVQRSDQSLAPGVVVGMRFPSAQVVRMCDVKAMQLAKALKSDGRWRLMIFAGDIRHPTESTRLQKLATYLDSEEGPIRRWTPHDADIDSLIEAVIVLSGERAEIEQLEWVPEFFMPVNGQWRMQDITKIYIDDESYNWGHGHVYDTFGIDHKRGAVVIVRPDQYVSMVVSLDDHEAIGNFFDGFIIPASPPPATSSGKATVGFVQADF